MAQSIADQHPQTGLIPVSGSLERYRVLEWLSFISAEIHKTLGALFNPAVEGIWRENQLVLFTRRADYLDTHFQDHQFLAGDGFSVADAYLFTVLGWTAIHGIDLSPWPNVVDYKNRVSGRPAVVAAMAAEGLIAAPTDLRKAS